MENSNLIEKMRIIRDNREKEIFETNQKENKAVSVEEIQYAGKMEFTEEVEGKKKIVMKDVFVLTEKSDDKQLLKFYDEDMNLLGVEIPETAQVIATEKSYARDEKVIDKLKKVEKDGKTLEELEKEEKENEKDKKEEISQDLSQDGQDLNITFYRKIIDKTFINEFPETCQGAQEIGMAYSEALKSYILVAKYQDKFEIAKGTEPAKTTMRQVYNVDRVDEKVTRESPHALMPIKGNGYKNGTKELSVTIGQYGYIETQVVDVSRENIRIGKDVAEDGEDRIKNEKTYEEKQQAKSWGTERVENEIDLIQDEDSVDTERMKQQIIENILETYGEELNHLYNYNQELITSSLERRIQNAVNSGKLTQEEIEEMVKRDVQDDIDSDIDFGLDPRRG